MQKQKVFIPVEPDKEVNEFNLLNDFIVVLAPSPKGSTVTFRAKCCVNVIKQNFKEVEGYFFTAEELRQFAIKVFEGATAVNFSGRNKKFSDPVIYPEDFKNIDRKEYIGSLNIKQHE